MQDIIACTPYRQDMPRKLCSLLKNFKLISCILITPQRSRRTCRWPCCPSPCWRPRAPRLARYAGSRVLMVSPKRPARAAARSPRWCALPLPWRPGPLVSWIGCRRRLSPARQKFLLVVWRCCRRSDCCFLLLRCGPWPGCRESGQLLLAGQRCALSGGARILGG